MILVSRNIRHMWIFAGFLGRGRQTTAGSTTTTVFGYFGGYLFGNFGDKASIISWRYACSWLQNEWPNVK